MVLYLRSLAGCTFYVLGTSFFVAALLLRNDIEPRMAAWWLQVAELPFALSAFLYGGLSLYFSLCKPGRSSMLLAWGIGVPLALFFLFLLFLNFYSVLERL